MARKDKQKIRNIMRKKILMKGWASVTDIRNFIPCKYDTALEILAAEQLAAEKEGKTTQKGISSKRLLKYVDLTIEEIHQYAEIEKKELSSQ